MRCNERIKQTRGEKKKERKKEKRVRASLVSTARPENVQPAVMLFCCNMQRFYYFGARELLRRGIKNASLY